MGKNVGLGMVVPVMLALVLLMPSCNRKMVQTEPVSATDADLQKAPERVAEDEEPAVTPPVRDPGEVTIRNHTGTLFVNTNIHFALDSYALSGEARQILRRMADHLRGRPDVNLTIEGHCDDRGTEAYNLALGERRAQSVKDFMADLGISSDRLGTISYGEERPLAMGHNEAAWAENRRAQLVMN